MKRIITDFDVPSEMRDGTVLYSNIFRPADDDEYPVALCRTPYSKDLATSFPFMDIVRLARTGYVVVVQDVRGRFSSEGEWSPFEHEFADGFDTVQWAARIPGSSGRVGMWGVSYTGFTQLAAALEHPPALGALLPVFTPIDATDGLLFRGGARELGLLFHFFFTATGIDILHKAHADDPEQLRCLVEGYVRAVDDLSESRVGANASMLFDSVRKLGLDVPLFREAVSAMELDRFKKRPFSIIDEIESIDAPALFVSGWYDVFSQGTIDAYCRLAKGAAHRHAPVSAARGAVRNRIVIGPWSHLNFENTIGEQDFGLTASMSWMDGKRDLVGLTAMWFDSTLKGLPSPLDREKPVQLFVTGADRWIYSDAWPLASTEYRSIYLCAGQRLSDEKPSYEQDEESYLSDPADPVPVKGGALLIAPYFQPGVKNQVTIEDRSDVLTFTGNPLDGSVTVAGPIKAKIWVACDDDHADFVVRLVDVHRNGFAENITDGIARVAPYGLGSDVDLQAGPVEILIDLWSRAHAFAVGHCIRIDICGSNYPRWDLNTGLAERAGGDAATRVSKSSLFHGRRYPSRVLLPVVETLPEETHVK